MRKTNPASNEPLLTALSAELVKQKYDLKALMRLICSRRRISVQPATPYKHGRSAVLQPLLTRGG